MTTKQIKQRFQRAIVASDKRSEREQNLRVALGKRLAAVIAKENGIAVGKFYYVLPIQGQNGGRKYRAEVVAIDRYWRESEAAEYISVLVKYYNRNGAFKTEWVTTEGNEFTPTEQPSTPR